MLIYSSALKNKNDSRSKISKYTIGILNDGNFESPTVTFNEIKRGKESKKCGLGLSFSISIKGSKKIYFLYHHHHHHHNW